MKHAKLEAWVLPHDDVVGARQSNENPPVVGGRPHNCLAPEGFNRRGIQEDVRFHDVNISEGSLEEYQYFLILGYVPSNEELMSQSKTAGRLLGGLISSVEHVPSEHLASTERRR